jgi:tetratricopeptide (TPR) repeat protein
MDQKKLIEAPRPEFYDLSSDPKEAKNIIALAKIPASLKVELQQHIHQATAEAHTPDPETREKLASLGYVTGGSAKPASSSFDPKDGIGIWIQIEEAVQLAQLGKFDQAKLKLSDVLKKQPENVMAETILGNIQVKMEEFDDAIRHFQNALRSNLASEETRYDLAEIYYERKQYNQALKELEILLQNNSSNTRAMKLAALCYVQTKSYEKAASTFEKVLSFYPRDATSLTEYARILSYLQRDQEALNAYTKLSGIRSLTDEESIQVAAIYLTLKDVVNAERYFQMAVQTNPKSNQAWRGLGLIRLSKNEFSPALEAFLKAGDCDGARQVVNQDSTLPENRVKEFERMCKAP